MVFVQEGRSIISSFTDGFRVWTPTLRHEIGRHGLKKVLRNRGLRMWGVVESRQEIGEEMIQELQLLLDLFLLKEN